MTEREYAEYRHRLIMGEPWVPPEVRCDFCLRKAERYRQAGRTCGVVLPNGAKCHGVFREVAKGEAATDG